MKKYFTLLLLFSLVQLMSQNHKGLYVNDFKNIVGNYQREIDLLHFAEDNDYDYLLLYNLYFIHNNMFDITDSTDSQPLANFIKKAKTEFGIVQIAGIGETYNSFNTIHTYNLNHIDSPNQRIDVYNIEFEFWNAASVASYYCPQYLTGTSFSCDTAGAFDFISKDLCKLDSLCGEYDFLHSEIYIGNPTNGQCANLSLCADRVLVHFYRSSDTYTSGNSIYNYKKERIKALASLNENSVVMPIFNCKESFMGGWLDTVAETQAFDTWMNGVNGYVADTGIWKSHTTVDGPVWFKYTCMYDTSIHFIEDTTEIIDDTSTTRLSQIDEKYPLLLYPNPSNNLVYISFKQKIKSIAVYNFLGKLLFFNENTTKKNINLTNLNSGIYFVKITDYNKRNYVQKLILKK